MASLQGAKQGVSLGVPVVPSCTSTGTKLCYHRHVYGAEDTGTSAEGTGLSEKQKGSPQAVQADSQTRQEQGKSELLIFDAAAGVLPA